MLCYFPCEWLIIFEIFEQPLDFPEFSSDFLLHEFRIHPNVPIYVQNLRCIPTTPCELFLTSSFISLMKYPKHCRLLFQFAHRLFLDIIFSPSKQHPWTRKEKLLSKNVHVRSHGRSAKFHQHGTPWQKPHPHPMMFDYALRLQNGEKVKKRVSCVSSPDNTSFHVRFC